MTVIGIDDTDSRERGMCTTYVAARLGDRIREVGGTVDRTVLVRLNPAVEHKTRGNGALAVHCTVEGASALDLVRESMELAETGDARTNPGAVVADRPPERVPEAAAEIARRAVAEYVDPGTVRESLAGTELATVTRGNGRGLVGATAALGAWAAFEDWTYEGIAYRQRRRWGSERDVDRDSLFGAARAGYPAVWDTVDRGERTAVCVPRTPCPILYGIRGDDPDAIRAVADRIESEPVARRELFVTNQGTDAHLRESPDRIRDGRSYRVTGEVTDPPETREGGHVFLTVTGPEPIRCVAFEPTKRFRDRVRALRAGDAVTVCGEVADGTLKLEKFAARELVRTERATPDCPECGRSMESAGHEAGYRCRDCGTRADGPVRRGIERDIQEGWYEVPPVARRHIAKPLVRGGFDAPVHPER